MFWHLLWVAKEKSSLNFSCLAHCFQTSLSPSDLTSAGAAEIEARKSPEVAKAELDGNV